MLLEYGIEIMVLRYKHETDNTDQVGKQLKSWKMNRIVTREEFWKLFGLRTHLKHVTQIVVCYLVTHGQTHT